MTESVVFTGVGKPQEKRTLVTWGKERLKKSFTFAGAEESIREKDAQKIQQVKDVADSFPEEQKAELLASLEKSIKNSAKIKVAGNYGAVALVTTAVVGEGLLIGNYKGWADKLANKKYIGFVGKQAKWVRGGLDALGGKMGKWGSKARERVAEQTPQNVQLELSAGAKQVKVDLSALETLDGFTSARSVVQRAEEVFDAISERMKPLDEAYNVGQLFPNGIPDGFSLPEFKEPFAKTLVHNFINEAHGHGDQWQTLLFGVESDGAYSLLGQDVKFQTFAWNKAIQEMLDEGMIERMDLHENAFALCITNKFGDLVKKLAGKS